MKVTGNVKYIPAGTTQYIVDGSDGEINVDTSLSAITIILPNIINSGYTNSDKGFIINDISGNAATNNITITAINNTVNSQSSILISSNGGTAKCSIASMNEWFAVTEPSTGGMSGNLTPNYIPKAATSSTLNNSIIYQNGTRIGIGTINPLTNLHVSGTNSSAIITSSRYSDDDNPGGFAAVKARGTEAFPSGVLFGDSIMTVGGFGYHSGGAIGQAVGKMVYYAKEDFTGSANGTAFKISTTPIGATVDVFNFGINDNGDVSIGDINLAPTARLHVKGVDATSSNYALKVDNSSASPLLYVRNDGNLGIGTTPVVDSRLQINNSAFGKASISLGGADYYGIDVNTTGLSMLLGVNTSNNKQLWLADQDKLASNGTNPILQFGLFGTSPSAINAISTNGSYLDLVLQSNGGNVGISTGVINPTARLHVKGNSAPGDFIFKAEDAGGNPLLYVRNDGYTTIMDMVVGRGGGLISTNTVLGVAAIANATGGQNTGVGYAVLNTLNTGTGNTAIGYAVLANITSGTTNVGIGASVMQASNPSYSIGIGSGVLYQSSGTGNTGIGHGNFYNLSLGDYNTALGYNAGANVMHTQGNNNLFLGYMADVSTNNLTNASAIGANATVGASNSMVLGNGVNVGIGSSTPTSKLQVVGLPTYADNTAASGAGLTVGAMYIRTGHGLDIVV